jgi:Trk-type K+ transport system membrane component
MSAQSGLFCLNVFIAIGAVSATEIIEKPAESKLFDINVPANESFSTINNLGMELHPMSLSQFLNKESTKP